MTEEEAFDQWCPLARQSGNGKGGYNRDANGYPAENCMCIGSRCMAWKREYMGDGGYCGAFNLIVGD